jgi:predicted RNA-binding Zn ribbon-like protein
MDNRKDQFLKDGFGHILWLDIVNSEHYDGFGNLTDHLQDADWVATLLDHYRFANVSPDRLYPRLVDLRTWLRHIAQTLNRNEPLTSSDLDILNNYLAEPVVRNLRYSSDEGKYVLAFQSLQPGWRWVQAEVVFSLVDMLDPQKQKRVKICPNTGCNWVFFDVTRGNNRRWCNDLTCGNRDKVRRFRDRQKASAR